VKLSFLPFFCKASVEALKAFPQVNATINIDEGTITYFDAEHLGIAVDSERGLLVPVIRDAGDLNIAGLARRIADLAERTRTNKLSPDELSGGTFTVTNTGSRGALFDTPIINQLQVAILGTGAVVKRPVIVPDATGGRHLDPVDGTWPSRRPPPGRRRRRRSLPQHDEARLRMRRSTRNSTASSVAVGARAERVPHRHSLL
jgi:pyruvate/2-oxoglutarate dehydrogenase complex dihydrolipoamide acyltransferase (E2) component